MVHCSLLIDKEVRNVLKGLGGLGNLAGMGNLMKQMQEMQSKLAEIEEELAEQRIEGTAGGGMVRVVVNGKQEIQSITIDRELLIPDELDLLQDMIVAATNQALEESRELRLEKISQLTGGIRIPGLM
jgi:DNA-binding YbaB/EbfC family protein